MTQLARGGPKSPGATTTVVFTPQETPNETSNPDDPSPTKATSETYIYTIDAKHFLKGKEKESVNVYYKFNRILGRMFLSSKIELLRFDEESPISEAPDIPKEATEFQQYCKDTHIALNLTLHYVFKIKCYGEHFASIKRTMIPWLQTNNVFLTTTKLQTGANCTIGRLLRSHHRLTHRVSTTNEL